MEYKEANLLTLESPLSLLTVLLQAAENWSESGKHQHALKMAVASIRLPYTNNLP